MTNILIVMFCYGKKIFKKIYKKKMCIFLYLYYFEILYFEISNL